LIHMLNLQKNLKQHLTRCRGFAIRDFTLNEMLSKY
jgi:hypothetical protein